MIFKRDSGLLGILIGFSVPIFFYFFLSIVIPVIIRFKFSEESTQLFALIFNVPLLRYYLINLKYEKTGRGILFATFIYAFIWIYINQLFL